MLWLGYLLLISECLLQTAMAPIRKSYQRRAGAGISSTLVFMILSSLFVCLLCPMVFIFTGFTLFTGLDAAVIMLAIAFALILTLTTIIGIIGSKYGSLAVLSMYATLGTLVISTVFGLIYAPQKNTLDPFDIAALILAGVTVALSFVEERIAGSDKSNTSSEKKKDNKIFFLLCIIMFFSNGSALSIYYLFTDKCSYYKEVDFIFLNLIFSVIICSLVLGAIILSAKFKATPHPLETFRACIGKRTLILMGTYGLVYFSSEYMSLKTTTILPIVVQAPLGFALRVTLVALIDYAIFKQKLTKLQLIEMGLATLIAVLFAI